MNWPTHSDYQDAMQNPGVCFQEPELKGGTAATDMLGLPRVMSGNFASVYELHCNGTRWAVRCFVRQVPGQQGRYSRLSQHLNSLKTPYLVGFEYMLKGILIKGEWYPIVKMQWVEGVPLNTFIEEHVNEPEILTKLAQDWRNMMKALSEHKLAHGDLQHGNIMVSPQHELRLVDYDGMFAPIFGRGRAPELGHINFQHPRRTADFYQEDLDNFSALVVYTSIRAIAADPEIFQKFYTVDNLILSSADYKNPLNSAVFARLRQSKDIGVQQLTKLLEKCCVGPVECVPDFATVVTALDAAVSLESIQLKAAVAPTLSRPAPETPGSRPASDAAPAQSRPASRQAPTPASQGGTRSAYDNVPTARPSQASTFKTNQQPHQSRSAPIIPEQTGSGMPPWVWAIVGAAIVAIIGAIAVFVKFGNGTATQTIPTENPAPAKASPVSPQPKAQTAAKPPMTTPPAQKTDAIKLSLLGTLRGQNGSVDAVAYSRDGKLLASAGVDKSVHLWNVQSGEPKRRLTGASDPLVFVTFTPDSKTIAAVTSDNSVLFWDASTGQAKKTLSSEKNNLFPVALSSDAQLLATGGTDRKTVRLIDTATGSTKRLLPNHSSWIRSVGFSSDAKLVAVQCHDDSIQVWNANTGQLLQTLSSPGNTVNAPAFSSDGRFLATGGESRNVKVWDLQTGALHQTFSDHSGDIKACLFSADRRWLATASEDKTIKIWEVFTGQLKQTLSNHEGSVNSLTFSADGTLAASGSADGSVKLWQINP
jgi:hypothetical protein